jgi:hypothetical protein
MSSTRGKPTPAGDRFAHPSVRTDDCGEGPAGSCSLSTQVKRIGDRGERCGSVEITRYEKDDGRSLLLYSHRAERDS